jgi:hypothetical protein
VLAGFRRGGTPGIFSWRMCVDRQRVDGTGQFGRQYRIYHPMAVDPALPFERFRHNINPKVRLAARPVACVAFVQMGFICDIEAFRRESFVQLLCDVIFCGHDLRNIARYSFRSMTVSIAIHRHGDV